jgi:hypothetical protein
MNDTPKLKARSQGKKRYMGQPCIHGHSGERYVRNNTCVECHKKYKIYQPTGGIPGRKRKYPVLVGPPKPKGFKKHLDKYDTSTAIGAWIWRSKHGRKAKARSDLRVKDYEALVVTHCPLLEIELSYEEFVGNVPQNYATLDRIDSSKGYEKNNVQIISFKANTIKGDATIEEMGLLLKNWKNYTGQKDMHKKCMEPQKNNAVTLLF